MKVYKLIWVKLWILDAIMGLYNGVSIAATADLKTCVMNIFNGFIV